MNKWIVAGALVLSTAACKNLGGGGAAATTAQATPRTDDEKALYALGAMLGERIGEFNLSRAELELVKRGMTDQVTGATKLVDVRQYGQRLGPLAMQRSQARAQVEQRRGQQFAEQAAREPGAERLPSGLVYRELRAGTGPQPTATDTVTVHYRGTLMDGTEFDSSYGRNEPATFPLRGVIPCWTEGVQRLHVGGKAKLVCPSNIAYGDRGQRQIPPGATLVFEVELLGINGSERGASAAGAAGADGGSADAAATTAPTTSDR